MRIINGILCFRIPHSHTRNLSTSDCCNQRAGSCGWLTISMILQWLTAKRIHWLWIAVHRFTFQSRWSMSHPCLSVSKSWFFHTSFAYPLSLFPAFFPFFFLKVQSKIGVHIIHGAHYTRVNMAYSYFKKGCQENQKAHKPRLQGNRGIFKIS